MFEIDKTRKHFVPKLYLRSFCLDDSPGQIYVFDKNNPQQRVVVRSIENVEVSKDAYSVANDKFLQERENQWAEILEALKGLSASELNDFISDRKDSAALRAWLARFVVESKLRSRGFRKQMRERFNEVRLQAQKNIEAQIETAFPNSTEAQQYLKEMLGTDSERKFEALHTPPFLRGEKGEELYRLFEDGSWRFDEPLSGRRFITSDIPSMNSVRSPRFFMPLSPELCLMGMYGDARVESGLAPRVAEMSEWEMDLINRATFENAERFVYASSKAEILRARKQVSQISA